MRTPWKLSAAALAAVAMMWAGPVGQVEADKPPPRETSVAIVLSRLNQEAGRAWRESRSFPRRQSDFAQTENFTVPHGEIVRVLQRRLNPEPAIDGYVKWQLLSFDPDLSDLDAQAMHRLLTAMPKPLRYPGPEAAAITSSQTGMSVQMGGTRLGTQPPPDPVQAANDNIRQQQEKAQQTNRTITAYRDALLPRLPDDRGQKIIALFQDVRDRVAAGDPSTEAASRRLAQASAVARQQPILTEAQRDQLLGWTQELVKAHTVVVRGAQRSGNRLQLDAVAVHPPADAMQQLLDNLANAQLRE